MNHWGFYLVLGLTLIGLASANQIEEICKGNAVDLKTVGDIQPIIKSIQTGAGKGCSEKTKGAILDLQPIINANNVCSVETAKLIGHYYTKYIGKKSLLHFSSSLSDSIKNYFLAVGAKISGACETELMYRLEKINKERISEEEARELQNFNKHINQLSAVIGGTELRIEDLAIVIDMSGLVPKKSTAPGLATKQTLAVSRTTKEQVDRIKSLCHKKFKPVYDKLIIPLVILTNLGFAYTPSDLEPMKQAFKEEPIYQEWFSAVLICESTLSLKVVEALSEDDNGVTILGDKDLAKLGKWPDDSALLAEAPEEYKLKVRLMDYTNLDHVEVRKAAERVNEKRKEAKKLRKQVSQRLLQYLKGLTKSKVDSNGAVDEPEEGTTLTEFQPTDVKHKKHWIRGALLVLGSITAVAGFFTNPFAFLIGVALLLGLLITAAPKPKSDLW